MTDEQINIAIAEVCGWKYEKNETHAPDGAFWWSKKPEFPDYCNDLNAMHEAEMVLSNYHKVIKNQSVIYFHLLHDILIFTSNGKSNSDWILIPINADPSSLADSFISRLITSLPARNTFIEIKSPGFF